MCTTLHFKMAQVGERNLTALINLHCASVLKLNVIGDVILNFHHAPTVGRIFNIPLRHQYPGAFSGGICL